DEENATVEQIRKRSKWENDDCVCRDVKHTLKHKKEELTLIELGSHLHIDKSFKAQDSDKPKNNNVVGPSTVNMVEHNNSTMYNDNKNKRVKVGNKAKDSGTNGSGSSSSNPLKDLRFSSGNIVSLFNVLHVFNIMKNLVSSNVLHKCGYKQVTESDEFVLSKHDEALGKLKMFKTEVELQQRAFIERFRIERGGMQSLMRMNYHLYLDQVRVPCHADKCVYNKFDETGKGVIIYLYVDDMLIFDTNKVHVDLTKEFLSSRFSTKDAGEAGVILAAVKVDEWLKNLILEILLWSKLITPTFIRCDSVATLAKAYSQMYNEKSRHLGFRYNLIRELIMNGVGSIEFVRSQQNLADHLTKGLARDLVLKSTKGMGLKSNIVTQG
nr:zinc finger, CCHC-type [Tanacetum cinerariifolium]